MKNERGVAAVEFAIVIAIFLTLLLGIMDFGRMLFTWNSAQEATRVGVRTTVICGPNAPKVLANMQAIMPSLTSSNIQVDWYDGSTISTTCASTATCTGAAVRIIDLDFDPVSPWMGFTSMAVPSFHSYLPSESMGTDPNSSSVCS